MASKTQLELSKIELDRLQIKVGHLKLVARAQSPNPNSVTRKLT